MKESLATLSLYKTNLLSIKIKINLNLSCEGAQVTMGPLKVKAGLKMLIWKENNEDISKLNIS